MVRNNNMVPNGHFHKDWQRYIRNHFGQTFRKQRRAEKRLEKAKKLAPRPVNKLRPIVQCPTIRYHTKVRVGRGFSLLELETAKLHPRYAKSIGICVDYRRINTSVESMFRNAQKLRKYVSKLILFPLQDKIVPTAKYVKKGLNKIHQQRIMYKPRVITEEDKKFKAYETLRQAAGESKRVAKQLKRKKNKDDFLDTKK